jgi:CelD/BcsL family acetyltransferase involved in cellulose biosynthesis
MTNWDLLDAEPIAPHTGPFPQAPFLQAAARHTGSEVEVIGDRDGAAAVVESDGVVRFAGPHHLTDYHSPVGQDMAALVSRLRAIAAGAPIDLDSLPAAAADSLETAFGASGQVPNRSDDESCWVLDLSAAIDGDWEAVLPAKQRHEVRRKRRRFEATHGVAQLVSGPEHLDAFVDLHRQSEGDKAGFMTDSMAAFFEDLLSVPGVSVDVLHDGSSALAAAFGFIAGDGYYLYNSGFDRDKREISPGIVLVDALVSRSVADGLSHFDFLKGDEVYKQRMGARERPLFRLQVSA